MCASLRSCADESEAVRNRDAQHRRVALDVQAVPQPQRAELVLRQLPVEEAARLVAELPDALVHEVLVDFVVAIHEGWWAERGSRDSRTGARIGASLREQRLIDCRYVQNELIVMNKQPMVIKGS